MLLIAPNGWKVRREVNMPALVDVQMPRIVWLEPVPVVFAHDIATAKICGGNVSILFYLRREFEGETVACPNLELVRPLDSCLRETLRVMLAQQMGTEARELLSLH